MLLHLVSFKYRRRSTRPRARSIGSVSRACEA